VTWPPRSIVAPVTLAAEVNRVVPVAAGLAAGLGAELVLVGIAPLAPMPAVAAQAGEPTPVARHDEQQLIDLLVRERLDELSTGLPHGAQARTVLTWGSLPVALIAAARDEQADLIVVGMPRSSGIGHVLHDHADRYVLHHSDVPVLVVPLAGPRPRVG
jgi:nucleotide-binding universal stress UspA family protein